MSPKSTFLLFLSFFFLLSTTTTNAFNITRLLDRHPEFSTFNSYLTQTQLNVQINRRTTITVLAIDNAAMAPLAEKPLDMLKKYMGLHVILDYFDVQKISKLSDKSALLATLFQASGTALGFQGFLNVTDTSDGEVAFRSAVKDAPYDAKLVGLVAAQPYNISVLQINKPIMAVPGLESKTNSTAPKPAPVPPPSQKAAPPPQVEADVAVAPSEEEETTVTDVPVPAPAPSEDAADVADVPAPSPNEQVADDEPKKSSSARLGFGMGIAFMVGLVSSLVVY
ncbi:hypothetical protein RJ641_006327 [Dillenia turbinata]|uniref:FAS1 domain-containing protein n=1 Tax=Dillenia turbinata TaxID=194707 RepID=A0AAN8Z7G0_9MAGN